MFVVNISIDKIDDLYQIAAIRIKPKNTPKDGELCTYQWGLLNSKNQFKNISQKINVFKNGGIGKYKSWVHVDVRSGAARWNG